MVRWSELPNNNKKILSLFDDKLFRTGKDYVDLRVGFVRFGKEMEPTQVRFRMIVGSDDEPLILVNNYTVYYQRRSHKFKKLWGESPSFLTLKQFSRFIEALGSL